MASELKNKFIYQLMVSATQQAFTIFAAFGIPYYSVREVSMVRDDEAKRSILVTEMDFMRVAPVSATALG